MLSTLQKSKQLYVIVLDLISDYLDLLKVELKIREQQLAMRIAGFAVAALFGLLAIVFFGLAVIVSFWDSSYRPLAAWFVVLLYGGIAAIALNLCLKHFRSPPLTNMLRSELNRDLQAIKESL
jgi:uncharacterized membrane protein YqjE